MYTCVYSLQSFSLLAWLFVLENYNLGPAIAITPAGTSACYICTCVPIGSIRRAFYLFLTLDCRLGTNFHSAVCVSGDAAMAFGYRHFFPLSRNGIIFWWRNIVRRTTDSRSYFAATFKFVSLIDVSLASTFSSWQNSDVFSNRSRRVYSVIEDDFNVCWVVWMFIYNYINLCCSNKLLIRRRNYIFSEILNMQR